MNTALTAQPSYKFSHLAPAKGQEYERYYETNDWQRYLWSREQAALERVLEQEMAGRTVTLLDFACGTGRITSFLESKVAQATGVDVSESMLAMARQKLGRTELVQADITESDALAGRRFNLVTAFRFFSNAEPALRSRVMRSLAELLTEDGVLVFNNHQNAWAPYPLARYFGSRCQRSGGSPYRVMSPRAMRRLCHEAGLKIVRWEGIGLVHLPKVKPSLRLNQITENWSRHFPPLRFLAQDLVAICRRCY